MRRPPKGSHLAAKKNSTYWKRQADKLWGQIIHGMYDECFAKEYAYLNGLEPCGGPMNAHHLVTRRRGHTRHAVECGIRLCVRHHTVDELCSAHEGPEGFVEMMKQFHPEHWAWRDAILRDREIHKHNYREAVDRLEDVLRLVNEGFKPVWVDGRITFE